MHLFNMGSSTTMLGDVYEPLVGPGNLLIVTSGYGDLATVRWVLDLA
jgi:hypothetical protein